MRVALLVAGTELRRRLRDRSVIITGFVAPFALAAIMGIAFHPARSGPAVSVGLVDESRTPAARAVVHAGVEAAALPSGVFVVALAGERQLDGAMASGRVAAGVVVPDGLRVPPRVVGARSSPVADGVASGLAAAVESRLVAARLADAVVASAQPSLRPGPPAAPRPSAAPRRTGPPSPLASPAGDAAAAAAPPVTVADEARSPAQSLMGYFAPSMAIVFLFIGAGAGARSILAERTEGTLARLAAAPVAGGAVVAGKVLGLLAVALAGMFTVWGASSLAFGARWGSAGGVAALCVATAVAMAGLATLITVWARDQGQADAAVLASGMVLALLGGNFFPPGSMPRLLADLSLATPNGWAMQGFGSLAIDGVGSGAVMGPVLALCGFAAGCAALASGRLRAAMAP